MRVTDKPGDLFLKAESLDSISGNMVQYVLILCFARSVLHLSSAFWYRLFKQIMSFYVNAVFPTCELANKLSLHSSRPCVLGNGEYQHHQSILSFDMWKPEMPR